MFLKQNPRWVPQKKKRKHAILHTNRKCRSSVHIFRILERIVKYRSILLVSNFEINHAGRVSIHLQHTETPELVKLNI